MIFYLVPHLCSQIQFLKVHEPNVILSIYVKYDNCYETFKRRRELTETRKLEIGVQFLLLANIYYINIQRAVQEVGRYLLESVDT